jgi:phage repressor protein C with HTH and peptisase S24 domain
MNNHRITTTLAVAAAALAAAAPASYGGPSLSAAVHLEAHANADTSAAKTAMRTSSARARKLMARGARELSRAAAIVRQADAKAQAAGAADRQAVLDAQASLSTAASSQSFTLSSIAQRATGVVAKDARRAQAKVESIRTAADDALSAGGSDPAQASVSVSAQAGAGGDDQTVGGVELLGIFAGGGEQ